jgi:ketosteroid isomerase-like protein
MLRSLMIVPALVIGLTMPATAQQISEQEARQVVEKEVAGFDSALRSKDVAKSAAVFTEDAVRVTPDGPVVGRSAIEKDLTEAFKVYNHDGSKVNQVKVINGMIFANGSWGGKIQSSSGLNQIKGFWSNTWVLDGGIWKMRMDAFNQTQPPPSATPNK